MVARGMGGTAKMMRGAEMRRPVCVTRRVPEDSSVLTQVFSMNETPLVAK